MSFLIYKLELRIRLFWIVKYLYSKSGKTLSCTACDMYTRGKRVIKLAAGDLMFFAPNKASKQKNVSIYIGTGKMIHSSSKGRFL
ncbi:NlpC/P60 family protein [Peribacillus glennii]|nr:NlpC/P60 family protein [Peribacillus glennii]